MASPSALGWMCIIENLADSNAELPLLKELINRVPNFYTDAPESVQERLALRYLEECASRGIVGTKGNTGGAIDISQSTVEFLCKNLTRPIDPSETSQSRILPASNHIREFISQKRSALPKSSIDLLKEYVSGANAKLPPTREDISSSSHKQEDNVVGEDQEVSHRQEDNIVDKEQEMISSPRSAGWAEPLHNYAFQNLPSPNALDTDKTPSEPLQENTPTTVIGNVSNLEPARSEPLSDDMNQFILKRRDAVPKTSVDELKEPIPETCIPTEPARNENDNNLRSNTDLEDEPSDCESYFMGSAIPISERNQCIACNKGGQLLTCSRKGCGITVHESCIMTTPSSFGKEGWFYCPCCAYARAKKVFSLARESRERLSSFFKMKKDQNQEKGEKGKQPVEKNITDKRKGKKDEFSDNDTPLDEDGDATLAGLSGDSSSSWESASRDSRRKKEKNGKRKERQVKSNDRNVPKDRDMLRGRGEEAKRREADVAFTRLDKYIHVKSGPGATSGSHKAVSTNEERGNEKRRENRVDADANRKRHKPTPRYSNKVVAPRRRTMLPWSAEEEQALREGMQKFGVTAYGRIPWSTILEYYHNAFHQTRLPIDLKDKWRNMTKKEGSIAD